MVPSCLKCRNLLSRSSDNVYKDENHYIWFGRRCKRCMQVKPGSGLRSAALCVNPNLWGPLDMEQGLSLFFCASGQCSVHQQRQ